MTGDGADTVRQMGRVLIDKAYVTRSLASPDDLVDYH